MRCMDPWTPEELLRPKSPLDIGSNTTTIHVDQEPLPASEKGNGGLSLPQLPSTRRGTLG